MPNIDYLIQTISKTFANTPLKTAQETTLDLQYEYRHFILHADTARHCNFNLVKDDMTGTYGFRRGFYGLTDMPAEFQKAIDCTLFGLNSTFRFLDDVLKVSRHQIENHLAFKRKCPIKLDEEHHQLI